MRIDCEVRDAAVPDFRYEDDLPKQARRLVAGMDEVGRGPLAGPVCAAVVVLDRRRPPPAVDDSKALTAKARESLFAEICAHALAISFASASAREIDAVNIRQATHLAMRRAVAGLALPPSHILVDGNDPPPGLPCATTAIVKGDSLSLSIAAASIVAKVLRDRMMTRLAVFHPEYEFEKHAGYATARHLAAIDAHGPCRLHRMTFSPMRQGAFAF
ncbi:MAG TPA: ribonuclease HII [Rhodoblastus sp.]|nr:ribonuclease HII [Rhodoblastus sp.]